MKVLLATAMVFGSTVGTLAADSYADYRDYFDAKPVATDRAPRGASKRAYGVDTRRPGDERAAKSTANFRPGYWNQAGGYVPPDYSLHPRGASQDGFWTPNDASAASWGGPRAFTGTLGTRR
ncbi:MULTISPECIES: hypothetical protein [unclassified Methylobacterium]|uniref:hypothetical protein n=1 Tax=unclassified Methylobacterium TaxID=2615210 RepID=UPI000344F70F|nr:MULTISPECIES: hypothetical protein [unclassified Methylobacterium]MBN4096894.1 hypothetical protein [Methylobacterium sp. OT2]